MVRPIMKDPIFLARPCAVATVEDASLAIDLVDTITAHQERCVGMAANMIGVAKRAIVVDDEGTYRVLFNPKMVKASKPYSAEEGCLSLEGVRQTKRYGTIKVEYQTTDFQVRMKTFQGWTAQIIQHQLDHLEGILI